MSNTGAEKRRSQHRNVVAFDQHSDRAPVFSDDALALRFASRYADELRYVANWSQWLHWDGKRWQFDRTLAAFDRARAICREAAAECNKSKLAKELASGKTVAAVERLARSDRRLAATIEQWDADPWLLNTPEGVIDLRGCEMREHRAGDYLTRMTAVAPDGDCPQWHAFLDRITNKDEALQQYLQRVSGYALTGLTRAHAMFFLWGTEPTAKALSSIPFPAILATITAPRRSRPSPPPLATGTQPTLRACAARGSSPPPRPKKVGAGPKPRSRR